MAQKQLALRDTLTGEWYVGNRNYSGWTKRNPRIFTEAGLKLSLRWKMLNDEWERAYRREHPLPEGYENRDCWLDHERRKTFYAWSDQMRSAWRKHVQEVGVLESVGGRYRIEEIQLPRYCDCGAIILRPNETFCDDCLASEY